MIDALAALSHKRNTLLFQRHKLEEEYETKLRDIDNQIEAIDMTVEMLDKALVGYRCPRCNGNGFIRRCDAAGQMESEQCDVCRGTGIRAHITKEATDND